MCIDLIKVKKLYLSGRTMKVQNVGSTLFWNDSLWGGGERGRGALCIGLLVLYELCEKDITAKDFYLKRGMLTFRRRLPNFLCWGIQKSIAKAFGLAIPGCLSHPVLKAKPNA
jgi:hypothetical protein